MIIAITGLLKSGKSESAKIIKRLYPNFQSVNFADRLKKEISDAYDIPLDDLYDSAKKEKYRGLMQDYGQQKRVGDPLCWVTPVMTLFDSLPGQDWLIEDLRFSEELQELTKRGAKILKIYADDATRAKRGAIITSVHAQHSSETDVAALPSHVIVSLGGQVIYNNKGILDLQRAIETITLDWIGVSMSPDWRTPASELLT